MNNVFGSAFWWTAGLLLCFQTALTFSAAAQRPLPRLNVQTNALPRSDAVPASFAPIVKKVGPSVVTIYSTRTLQSDPRGNPMLNDPFFRRFFGMEEDENGSRRGRPRSRQEQG